MNTPRLRIGLIGTGRIGHVHAGNIARDPEADLTWVADPFVEAARRVAEPLGARVSDDAAEAIASRDVDALVVASPTATHIALIEAAVDAGLPVLCEKPIDLDITRVDGLRDKVAASGVPVALGFNRRFDSAFSEVRHRVAGGEIGALEQLIIISRDPAPPPAEYLSASGGIFRDMTIHDLDMARFFVPDIVEVVATGIAAFDDGARLHGDFDTATTTLRSAGGALVTILNSRHSAFGYDQRIEAFGAEGMLQVANAGSSLVSASGRSAVEVRRPYLDFFIDRYAAAYALELSEFIKLARGQSSSSPTFEDGRAALVLADAAGRSAREGVAVQVDLN